jgi:hypothetical protein
MSERIKEKRERIGGSADPLIGNHSVARVQSLNSVFPLSVFVLIPLFK